MTIAEINGKFDTIKSQAKGIIENSNTARYEIHVFSPAVSQTWAIPYKGNTDKEDEEAFERFCKQLDSVLADHNVYAVKVVMYRHGKGSKTPAMCAEVQLKEADGRMVVQQSPMATMTATEQQPKATVVEEPKTDVKDAAEKGMTEQEKNMRLLSMALFGHTGLGDAFDQFGIGGALLGAQRLSMEQQYERERNDARIAQVTEENGSLKQEIRDLEARIKELEARCEKYKKKLDSQKDYDKLKSRTGQIGEIAAQMLAGVGVNMLKATKYGALLGLDDTPLPTVPHNDVDDVDDEDIDVDVEPLDEEEEV